IDLGNDDDVAKNPEAYMGKNVRIKGEVQKLVGDRGALVDLDGWRGFDEVLIFNNTGTTVPLKKGDKIEVTGPVHALVISELEQEVNTGLRDDRYTEYRDLPVITATMVKGYWPGNRPSRPLQRVAREKHPTEESLGH